MIPALTALKTLRIPLCRQRRDMDSGDGFAGEEKGDNSVIQISKSTLLLRGGRKECNLGGKCIKKGGTALGSATHRNASTFFRLYVRRFSGNTEVPGAICVAGFNGQAV